jgi:hypothetical protein
MSAFKVQYAQEGLTLSKDDTELSGSRADSQQRKALLMSRPGAVGRLRGALALFKRHNNAQGGHGTSH